MKETINNELKNLNANKLLHFRKRKKNNFLVPNNYFEDKKKELIAIDDSPSIYSVPESYFDHLSDRILQNVEQESQVNISPAPSISSQLSNEPFRLNSYFIAVSAAIICLFFLYKFQNPIVDNFINPNQLSIEQETFTEEELAFIYNNSEDYYFNALLEDFSNEDSYLDPLFDSQELNYDELFQL